MLGRLQVPMVLAVLALSGTAATAHAELGPAFATATLTCPADGVAMPLAGIGSTGPVAGDHERPVVRITGTAMGAGSVDMAARPPDGESLGEDSFWLRSPATYWAGADSIAAGDTELISADCAERPTAWTATVRWYDRPEPPAAFSGSRNHHQSHLGFTVPEDGRYVAEVDPGVPGLRVALESYALAAGGWTEDGEPRAATFESAGVLDLGVLTAGDHSLTVQARQAAAVSVPASESWWVLVRPHDPSRDPVPEEPALEPDPWFEDDLLPYTDADVLGEEPVAVARPRRTDRTRPFVRLSVAARGALRTVRARCPRERCRLRLTVRAGPRTASVSRDVRRGHAVTVRIRRARGRPLAIVVVARDAAGNRTRLRRTRR
jgi:hypothetical protein